MYGKIHNLTHNKRKIFSSAVTLKEVDSSKEVKEDLSIPL